MADPGTFQERLSTMDTVRAKMRLELEIAKLRKKNLPQAELEKRIKKLRKALKLE
jgi:hypothetical protein